jgi:predicted ATPase
MHVRSVHLHYFKKFRDRQLRFVDSETGLARNLIVLVGNNGGGKSTVLQAIAATLGTATRRLSHPADLDWPGYNLSLVGNSWRTPSEVNVEVSFTVPELEATGNYFGQVPGLADRPEIEPPSHDPVVTLTLKEGKVKAASRAQYFQFRGREYAKQILRAADDGYDVFKKVGTTFWYTEHRTATSLTAESDGETLLHYNEDLLRRRLADLMQFHQRIRRGEYELRVGQRDFFAELEQVYSAVFPDRRFEGPVPRADVDDIFKEPWFFLYDGHFQYEISEMSGGERAIFPLLFDFANWNINNSVILIDEIELHLHPPLQQAFVRALSALGENNQFIITTHSDWVVQAVPPESVVRLED